MAIFSTHKQLLVFCLHIPSSLHSTRSNSNEANEYRKFDNMPYKYSRHKIHLFVTVTADKNASGIKTKALQVVMLYNMLEKRGNKYKCPQDLQSLRWNKRVKMTKWRNSCKIPWMPGIKQFSWKVWKTFWKNVQEQCIEENKVFIKGDRK